MNERATETEPEGTSTLAIVSFALSVLGLTALPFIGSVLAIGFGIAARRRIRASDGRQGGMPLVRAGIGLGALGVGVALIFLLFAVRL